MSVIGIMQQTDPCVSLERNSLISKCSSVAEIFGSREALSHINYPEHSSDIGFPDESQSKPLNTSDKKKKKEKKKKKKGKSKIFPNIDFGKECLASSGQMSVVEDSKVKDTKQASTSSSLDNPNVAVTCGSGICSRVSEKDEKASTGVSAIEKVNKGTFQRINNSSLLHYCSSYNMNSGKENDSFTWQKTGRYVGSLQPKGNDVLKTYITQNFTHDKHGPSVLSPNNGSMLLYNKENVTYRITGMWISKSKVRECEPNDSNATKIVDDVDYISFKVDSHETKLSCDGHGTIKESTSHSEVGSHNRIPFGKNYSVFESYHYERGIPIAEFERLLISVAPIIESETPLCKSPNPKILLLNIWNWYEEPENYGVQVKAEDYEQGVSFEAHFVPYLSAIQLFGFPYKSEQCSCPYHSELVESFHVIFEYFEHEPPQQRMPLLSKIKELAKIGSTCNSQVFGDPSKLECMSLQDLHFASWYSVAWYPIYRIPEGCLRASFLTYHSLSHLQLQPLILDSFGQKRFCLVSPVLGMLSYNTQGECWLKSNPKDGCEELLEQRVKALEETAAMFSRRRVLKDNVFVTNRHPDYEFFLSRKR